MSRLLGASAPGKLVLTGEYAVLFGAPAVVTAVDRRAEARLTADPSERPRAPEAALAVARVEAAHGPLERGLVLDVSALRTGQMKLGLGSSAAAAVAAAVAAELETRGALSPPRDLFELAYEAHREIQPGGSGVDVAASAHGGTLRFTLGAPPRVEPLALPAGLALRVVFTGREASTQAMLASMRRFEAAHPTEFGAAIASLARAAERAASAMGGAAREAVDAAGRYGDALRDFGERAGIPIVEEGSRAVDALAREHGGRAKPSGAGGGDVAVAFFSSAADAERFERAALAEGLSPLSLAVDAEGPRPLLA